MSDNAAFNKKKKKQDKNYDDITMENDFSL